MSLVTVGTQFFDSLIDEVDRLAAADVFDVPVLAQIGLAKRFPKHVDHFPFDDNIRDKMNDADLIITHAGTGSLIECITSGHSFIAVVNDTKAGNHQLEFLEALSKIYDFCWIASPRELESALPQARPARSLGQPGLSELADHIRAFLNAAATSPPAVKRRRSEPIRSANRPCLSASE